MSVNPFTIELMIKEKMQDLQAEADRLRQRRMAPTAKTPWMRFRAALLNRIADRMIRAGRSLKERNPVAIPPE